MSAAKTVVCFIGMPGAGKTTAAEMAAEAVDDSMLISTGDIVRELAAEHFGTDLDDLTGEQIGEFSTMKRENESTLYVAIKAIKRMKTPRHMAGRRAVMLEGVRDKEASSYYRENVDDFRVVLIDAPFETRLQRLGGRGREDDEKGMTPADLMHREQRELGWGMDELPDEADRVIMNTGDELDLQRKVMTLLAEWGLIG